MRLLKKIIVRIVPSGILAPLLATYHYLFAWGSAFRYGFPAKKLFVIGVTGTKGKSTTTEMVNAILEEAGYTTALSNTIRFKIAGQSKPNLHKMSMPGRGYLQRFLSEALRDGCTHAIMEITSEGARQFRHIGIPLDVLVFTNIAREHIESHGTFENYKNAKRAIANALVRSSKRPRVMVTNALDDLGKEFLTLPVEKVLPFDRSLAAPYTLLSNGSRLTIFGMPVDTPIEGEFNIENAMGAATLARAMGVAEDVIAKALKHLKPIKGRVERVHIGQPYTAIVDYAHTPDSLRALYEAFPNHQKICVLGNTGGGRDTWKRPEMAKIAETYCEHIILTNEDPYDEDPRSILHAMASGMDTKEPTIILDRREAIREALSRAKRIGKDAAVLITGKGTDPYIMGPQGTKTPWSDKKVVEEELVQLEKGSNVY
jgi:UDP-N-acetylmuramoyl-L-alanyl-D-glutamate--2,6-diaminopimelate ligase